MGSVCLSLSLYSHVSLNLTPFTTKLSFVVLIFFFFKQVSDISLILNSFRILDNHYSHQINYGAYFISLKDAKAETYDAGSVILLS